MLEWCCFLCKSNEYEEIEEEDTTYFQRECDAIFLGIEYTGYISIQSVDNPSIIQVKLFDRDVSLLYPEQIREINKLYNGHCIVVKWMDAASLLASFREHTPRLCQIHIGDISLSDVIKEIHS